MDKLVIEGGRRLKGEVSISGSKNALLPILAATLLTDEPCVIHGAPNLRDTLTMIRILRSLGKSVDFREGKISIKSTQRVCTQADYKLVSTMRASFCVLGPLLARYKKASVSLPGGCVIGLRPVDLHLKGLKALGANIDINSGYVHSRTRKLSAADIYLGGAYGSSVLATANVMMAAVLASGTTKIESAACEPEIADLAGFLNKMGAKIKGLGTPLIQIKGVRRLSGVEYKIIPDRIEAGTFIIAALISKGEIKLRNVIWQHLGAVIDKLAQSGADIQKKGRTLKVGFTRKLSPLNITTLPYPGFPTDMQAQMMSLMSLMPGVSIITEKVYPDRFMHIAELNRMGAHIQRQGPHAIIEGVGRLSAASVMASDLRASACLLLAGLAAEGRTSVSRIYHLERGYEKIDEKLIKLGAKIWRERE